MSRCKKKRCCRFFENEIVYKPVARPMSGLEIITLELDEFEVLRLCDYEGANQIEAAEKMKISRGTIQRLLKSGRFKIIDALLNQKAIQVKNK